MGAPDRVLVLSSRLDPPRRRAFNDLFQMDGRLEVIPGAALPDLSLYRAVLLDGPQDGLTPEAVERLRGFVAAGGSLIAVGAAPAEAGSPLAALLGAVSGPRMPQAELLSRAEQPDHELLARAEAEFPLLDTFAPLLPSDDEAQVLLRVRWAFRDQIAAFERHFDRGRIVVTSLGNAEDALRRPSLATLLRRAARPPGPATPQVLKVGLVGYGPQGGMGFLHGTAVEDTAGMRFVAVCDRSSDRLDAARADFPGIQTYADDAAIARDADIALVIVATPPVAHGPIVRSMLEAGKHVLCEKPLCFTTAEADALISLARSSGLTLSVNQNRRWDPDFLALRRAVEDGMLGDLFNVETFAGDFAHPCQYWHSDVAISGGAVYDWGAHHVDWILQLLGGMPATVSAFSHKRVWHDVTNSDQVRLRMLWADGREAEFVYSDVAAVRRPKFYLQGTRGTLVGHYRPVAFERLDPAHGYVRDQAHYAEAPSDLLLARYEAGAGIAETRLPLPRAPQFPLHRNLADHLLLNEPLAVEPESARNVVAVLEAAQRSAERNGAPIAL